MNLILLIYMLYFRNLKSLRPGNALEIIVHLVCLKYLTKTVLKNNFKRLDDRGICLFDTKGSQYSYFCYIPRLKRQHKMG